MKRYPLLLCATVLALLVPPSPAQVIPNPSFEADTFTVYPGYSGANGGITGWSGGSAGLNPSSGSPFADNGVIPHGANVAFIQSSGSSDERLTTTITGLTPGVVYEVSFRSNSRAGTAAPDASWSLNGEAFVPFTSSPAVGGAAPYYTVIGSFTATGPSAPLAIRNQTASDSSVLVDDFRVVAKEVPGSAWTVSRWVDDASTSISTAFTQWAYNFRSSDPGLELLINGVPLGWAPGGEPEVVGRFAITGADIGPTSDSNQINALPGSGSPSIASSFIYGGDPTTITLEGLTTWQGYRVSIFGVGFSDGSPRVQVFSSGSDERVIDEEAFGENNGMRIDHTFVADGTERTITITPAVAGSTFHLYGLALHRTSLITTLPVSDVADGDATLHGSVNPDGQESTVWFEWGDAGSPFGQQTPSQNLGSGDTEQPFSAPLTGLTPGILYQGRAVLSNALGLFHGETVSFRSGFTTTVSNADDDGPGSLRQSVADAAAGDTIDFAPGLSGQTVLLTSGPLVIDKELSVNAASLADGLTVDGNEAGRVVEVLARVQAALGSLTLQNGVHEALASPPRVAAFGGAIRNAGTLTLDDVILTNNTALGSPLFELWEPSSRLPAANEALGGAVYNTGVLTMNRVTLTDNSAIGSNSTPGISGLGGIRLAGTAKGGAICNLGTLTMQDCLIDSNFAKGGDVAFTDPSSTGVGGAGAGGGIHNVGTLTIVDSSLVRNTARHGISQVFDVAAASAGEGGGIYNIGTATVNQCTLAENLALGGGIGLGNPSVAGSGGGIHNGANGNLTVNQSTISTNRAGNDFIGPFALANDSTEEELLDLLWSGGNEAALGGGITNVDDSSGFGTITVFNTIVAGNSALSSPGLGDFAVTPARYTDQGGNLIDAAPFLGALQTFDGKGPVMFPLFGSPVIDAGLNSATSQFPLDQVGESRLVGANVDAGAVEYALTSVPVPSLIGFSHTVVSTEPVTGVNTVRLSATVSTDGASATGRFEHGPDDAYGVTAEAGAFGSYDQPITLTTDVLLGTGIAYHWRFIMESSAGTLTGPDQLVFIVPNVAPGDLDGDGVVTGAELTTILNEVDGGLATINAAGYFTEAQVQDLNVGTPLIGQVAPGLFRLTLGLEKSIDPATTPFADFSFATPGATLQVNPEGKAEFEFPADDDAAFFRLWSE